MTIRIPHKHEHRTTESAGRGCPWAADCSRSSHARLMGKLKVLDLFSGIGGFSLGLERTGGFETVAFCEIDPFCRRVLAKHWPGVKQYDDIRNLSADQLAADGIAVDVICGGFPCQDLSEAGARAGIDGERSGLWREYARLIGELRPEFALVENVPELGRAKTCDVSVFARMRAAYIAICERQMAKLQHEIAVEKATHDDDDLRDLEAAAAALAAKIAARKAALK